MFYILFVEANHSTMQCTVCGIIWHLDEWTCCILCRLCNALLSLFLLFIVCFISSTSSHLYQRRGQVHWQGALFMLVVVPTISVLFRLLVQTVQQCSPSPWPLMCCCWQYNEIIIRGWYSKANFLLVRSIVFVHFVAMYPSPLNDRQPIVRYEGKVFQYRCACSFLVARWLVCVWRTR